MRNSPEYDRKYYLANRDRILIRKKRYYQANKEEIKKRAKASYNPKEKSAYNKRYYAVNRNHLLDSSKQYASENRKQISEYRRKRYSNSLNERIVCSLRTRMRKALNGQAYKTGKTLDFLGCTVQELRARLENQFQQGMSWKNYGHGIWHIDHIRPCASFDLSDPEQQRACFHFSNLQPLFAKENLQKGAKYDQQHCG